MQLHFTANTECFITHHNDLDTPKYMHVQVPSGYLFHQMFYYTYCSIMDDPHYVQAHEPSNFPVAGTFYNTLHMDTDAPQYVQVDVLSSYLHY